MNLEARTDDLIATKRMLATLMQKHATLIQYVRTRDASVCAFLQRPETRKNVKTALPALVRTMVETTLDFAELDSFSSSFCDL